VTILKNDKAKFKAALTLLWPAGHICPTYKEPFQVHSDKSIPLFLHAAIYLEVSVFCWTSQNAFSGGTAVYKWYCVQCCKAALHTVSFVPSDCTAQYCLCMHVCVMQFFPASVFYTLS
jgi:hypothetical protein